MKSFQPSTPLPCSHTTTHPLIHPPIHLSTQSANPTSTAPPLLLPLLNTNNATDPCLLTTTNIGLPSQISAEKSSFPKFNTISDQKLLFDHMHERYVYPHSFCHLTCRRPNLLNLRGRRRFGCAFNELMIRLQGEDGFLITTPGDCLTDVSFTFLFVCPALDLRSNTTRHASPKA